jgi:hypothetical protein
MRQPALPPGARGVDAPQASPGTVASTGQYL